MRIDKWLWAARFYKTRSKAKAAVVGGKVHVNGNRVKPSHEIQMGDLLELSRGITKEEIVVTRLSERRESATLAQQLYLETDESIDRRSEAVAARRMERAGLQVPKLKPTKQARRELLKLKQKEG